MINRLSYWGYTLTIINDNTIPTQNYANINLLVLRYMESGVHDAAGVQDLLDSLEVPIVTMNAQEACETFGMGSLHSAVSQDSMFTIDPNHPVNRYLDTTFVMYTENADQDVLMDFTPPPDSTWFLTQVGFVDSLSGVCVRYDDTPSRRRIHYSPWDATKYTQNDGWRFFRNVIEYSTYNPDQYTQELSEFEGFEGPEPQSDLISIWDDGINPTVIEDTIPIITEDFEAFPTGPSDWNMVSMNPRGQGAAYCWMAGTGT